MCSYHHKPSFLLHIGLLCAYFLYCIAHDYCFAFLECPFIWIKYQPGTNKAHTDTNHESWNRHSNINVIGHSSRRIIHLLNPCFSTVIFFTTLLIQLSGGKRGYVLAVFTSTKTLKLVKCTSQLVKIKFYQNDFRHSSSSYPTYNPFVWPVSSEPSSSAWHKVRTLGTASPSVSVGGGLRSITVLLMQCFSIQRVL